MFPLPKGAAWKLLSFLWLFFLIEGINSEGRVVCYYTNWSVYRPGTAKFNPQNINPYLCTHLIYAFGGFTKDNTLKPFDKYQDIEQGGYAKFTGLKTYNKNLKTLLAIGGWNEGSSRFSPLVANPERRQQFIKNVLKFLRQNHFDGLDLDWEYPAYRDGGKPRDRDNYAQFVQELRAEFDRESAKTGRPRLLLTMAVPAGTEYIEKGYDIPKLNKYLDWFNVLSYDYHSAYEPSANHHSPLYSLEEDSEYNYDGDLNIEYSIKYYLNAGADKDKLVLGIPTYGRSYTLIDEDNTELGAPADGPGEQGDATREKGYLAYYEICQKLRDESDWTVVQPNPKAMGPYAYKGNQWVGYDDEAIVRKKAEYVAENGLGGIMFWSIDNDDFRGACGGKPYPLIEAAKEALIEKLGVGVNEVGQATRAKKPSRSRSRQGSSSRTNTISEDKVVSTKKETTIKKTSGRRRTSSTTARPVISSTTASSLYIGGRTTTPEPPTTPDPGADFKCEEEGFFPHPRDCKKYFWCLDSGPSNLGIVAHQFTCPSGLYFNPAADSCDFARNVLCKSKIGHSKTTPSSTTTTTTTSTTPSPRITAATSRSTFVKYSTTFATPVEEEYDEEEDVEDGNYKEPEEDPKVIKELIELIKKVGGLEELEKQLLQQEDGSMVIKKSDQVSTTQSTISKSLYEKVLSRPHSLGSLRNRLTQRKVESTATESKSNFNTENEDEAEITSKKADNKYSSVIRNSRPRPQNDGLEKLPEFEGFLREKPKYVTITRSHAQHTSDYADTDDGREGEQVEDYAANSQSGQTEKSIQDSIRRTSSQTSPPPYVNIRRSRPTQSVSEDTLADEEITQGNSKLSYESLNRGRTEDNEQKEHFDTTTSLNRYKNINRTGFKSTTNSENSSTRRHDSNDEEVKEDDFHILTAQNSDGNRYTETTQSSVHNTDGTTTQRIYSNIARKTTTQISADLPAEQKSILTSSDSLETLPPTTIQATVKTILPETTTGHSPTITVIPDIKQNSEQHKEDAPSTSANTIYTETEQSLIRTGSNTEGNNIKVTYQTDNSTDENLQSHHVKSDDEVTLTRKTVEVSSTKVDGSDNRESSVVSNVQNNTNDLSNSLTSINNQIEYNQNKSESSHYVNNVEKTHKTSTTSTVEGTTTHTTFSNDNESKSTLSRTTPISTTTTTTTTQTPTVENSTPFLGTVSSPRPFGYPKRKTRPTSNQEFTSDLDFSSTIPSTTKKIRPQQISPRPTVTRRPGLSVRRRLPTSSAGAATTATNLRNGDLALTTAASIENATGKPKYSRRTRPTATYLTATTSAATNHVRSATSASRGESRRSSAATPSEANSSEFSTNRPVQNKVVIRRKFGRPNGSSGSNFNNSGRRSPTTTIKPTTQSATDETISTLEPVRTTNPLFKRRYTFTPSTTASRTSKTQTTVATSASPKETNTPGKTSLLGDFTTDYPPSIIGVTDIILDSVDQEAGSSVQDSKFTNNRYNQIGEHLEDDLVDAIKAISKAPIPTGKNSNNKSFNKKNANAIISTTINPGAIITTTRFITTKPAKINHEKGIFHDDIIIDDDLPTTRQFNVISGKTLPPTITTKTTSSIKKSSSSRRPQKTAKISTTIPPPIVTTPKTKTSRRKPKKPDIFDKTSLNSHHSNYDDESRKYTTRTYRPTIDYDYYDDDDLRVVGKTNSQVKVILHGPGIIECLDQGNFPHPLSCRKFISCAKMEIGGVVGWEYTCPKGLSYDPVGGICNWAAGLGCKE